VLLKAFEGAILERRRLTKNHAATLAMATITTPPTTPPARAPTFELFEVEVGDEDAVAAVDEVVKDADTLVVEEIIELVDCTGAEDSGASKRK
jgi:hypothetical protein